ncbi:MAG: GNAT family N-acetyltransferase [Armatimonadetes bacterium]|nr:GNAT family N-acetyltransferase [Armatimonadota bacterium]
MPIDYLWHRPVAAAELAALYDRAALRRPTNDLPRMQKLIDHSPLLLSACDGDRLIGVARTLTDFAHLAYLADLAVDPDFQGQGIGKELIRLTRERCGPECMLLLLSAPGAMTYYPHIGFSRVENAWSLPREM